MGLNENGKKFRINDPIHGIIEFPKNGLIHQLIETREFQRLRRIRQLGTVEFVYPCAVHTRFSHSIGVAYLVEKAATYLLNQKDENGKNIFESLQDEGLLETYNQDQVVLALTCAGLLHDIGHTPFSHTLEDYYKQNHEDNSIAIIRDTNSETHQVLDDAMKKGQLPSSAIDDMASLLKEKQYVPEVYDDSTNQIAIFKDLISSQLDCDRIDYILRDNYFCGTPIRIDSDYILKCITLDKIPVLNNAHKIVFLENAISAIEHFLMSRWIHYKQTINHKACLSSEIFLIRVMEKIREFENNMTSQGTTEDIRRIEDCKSEFDLKAFLREDDFTVIAKINDQANDENNISGYLCKRFLCRKIPKLMSKISSEKNKDSDSEYCEKKRSFDLIKTRNDVYANRDFDSFIFEHKSQNREQYIFNKDNYYHLKDFMHDNSSEHKEREALIQDLIQEAQNYIYIRSKDGKIQNLAELSDIAKQPIANEEKQYLFIDQDVSRLIANYEQRKTDK
ncbi:MAG TPA: HD domain-containing protein [Caldisericia bacterium]|jgi:HD superfamily phosphohydrolase|nr:MAG: deoxyguanosinetriphosphate triphosphohydrolase-like protein [bacterium ADurb.Bin132]HNY61110.1 HD domain-containing protein [Caldisericia bacterium]HOC79082.1 HD domain-containing protein [Caldisericia bacterium]HOG70120.1 HD domain-containing protein [Caldisericia bacterium]HPA65476.1 HD domain-containing protein [Caldisericia bacterium]